MDWKLIKAEYIAGGTSYRKLAEKYGITLAVLRNVAEREEWVKLKAQVQHKTNTKLVESISTKNTKRAVTIISVADKLLEKALELAEIGITDTQGLKHLTSALKDLKEIKGLKSDADKREQEARIAKLRKEVEDESKENNEIRVTIESDLDEYSK